MVAFQGTARRAFSFSSRYHFRQINNHNKKRPPWSTSTTFSNCLTTSASTGESKGEKRVAVLPASLNSLGLKYLEADELRERFDKYDINKDGNIDEEEAAHILVDAGMNPKEAAETAHKVVGSINVTSTDHNIVSWNDFKAAVNRAAEPVSPKIWPVSFSLLLNYTGVGVTWPVLPILARSVGLGASELGIITGSAAFARICANVPAAQMAESIGRKPLLIMGPAIGSLGYLGYALGDDTFQTLVMSSALTGMGGALTSVGSGLFLSDISTPLNRARTMAPLMTTALLGFAMGPALGGFVAETYSLHTPFLVTATGLGCASLSALILLPETNWKLSNKDTSTGNSAINNSSTQDKDEKTTIPASQQWRELLRLPSMQGITGVAFMSGVIQGSSPVTNILFATETLGMSPGQLGVMFGVQILAMSVMIQPATALSDRYRNTHCRSALMLPGLAMSAAVLAGQPFTTSVWIFAGLGTLRAITEAMFVMPNMTPFIMDNTTTDQRAQGLAMRNMSQDVGILLGATSLGALAQFTTVPTAMLANAGLQALVTAFFYNRSQQSRKEKKEAAGKEKKKA